jgi:hypothetical protein
MSDMNGIGEALEALGVMSTQQFGALAGVFDGMEIAGEEMEKGMARWPERAAEIDKIWNALLPSGFFEKRRHPDLYRHHVRQLIDRCGQGEDLRPLTDAELLCAFMEAATHTPLVRRANGVIMMLFRNIFPDFQHHDDPELNAQMQNPKTYDSWGGEVEELIQAERMKHLQEFRNLA